MYLTIMHWEITRGADSNYLLWFRAVRELDEVKVKHLLEG